MGTLGAIKHKKNQPFTEFEVGELAYKMNKLDYSSINRTYNKKIQLASDIGMVTFAAAPLLLLADKNIRKQSKYIIPMWAEVFTFNFALVGMTKELVRRTRPYVFYDDVPMELKTKKDARASFFSGHTSMTAASLFFMAQVYSDFHPNSKMKPLVWTGAAVLPLTIGALRYGGGKHFWSDILVGYLIGASTGMLIPRLHKRAFD
ncbi:MAG: phosphatase PAP2 family protein [Chitinophagales bacterium]|nr:phosphatase PAP2 family protein [Chitinophagales bacterium]